MAEKKRWWSYLAVLVGAGAVWYVIKRKPKLLSGALGAAAGPIRKVQTYLNQIGVPVKTSGVLDDMTVQAINQIFDGSVDVPPKLATGQLTKRDIVSNISLVVHALSVIVRGAQNFQDVSRG